jgi:hypothetical protein
VHFQSAERGESCIGADMSKPHEAQEAVR